GSPQRELTTNPLSGMFGADQSTSPSSPCGSATKAPPPPASTCTPTWHLRKRPSPAPPRLTPQPDATSHPTNCWPSSASSDHPNPTRYAAPARLTPRQPCHHQARC